MTKGLTADIVKSASGAGTIWDAGREAVRGFGLRSYPSGAKSFFINYRLNGRERRHTIGEWPTWSVVAARAEAKALRQRIDRGEDPAGEKRERREAPTVQDLIGRYILEHLPRKAAGKPRTKIADQRVNDEKVMLDEIGDQLGKHTKVADVHFGDIQEMHRKISESIGRSGPRVIRANRILAIASKMFSLSLRPLAGEDKPWRDQAQGNPCKGVERNDEDGRKRERFFSKDELAKIADALGEYPGVAADCVRLIMFTGARPGEAMQARWEEFDKEAGYWIKPSAHTKQRRSHKVPLSPPAIELIDRLRKKRKNAAWVFPGQNPGEPLAALWHVWHLVRKRAELAKDEHGHEARVYDLRHTFASIGAGGGLSLPIIGRLLGHTQQRTTQRYAHLADDPLREAAEKIGAVIDGAGKAGAKVVSIKG